MLINALLHPSPILCDTFIEQNSSLFDWLTGFLIAFFLIFFILLLLGPPFDHARRLFGVARFIAIFIYAFIAANISVALLILFVPSKNIGSSIVECDISDLSKREALFLCHLITLTPGTVTAIIDTKKEKITVHCLHKKEVKIEEKEITRLLKEAIVRFTR